MLHSAKLLRNQSINQHRFNSCKAYKSLLQEVDVNGKKYKYYSLPELGDKRISPLNKNKFKTSKNLLKKTQKNYHIQFEYYLNQQ